jgi:hypothetical protein
MLNSVMNYMHIYISRPTVVVVDVLLLVMVLLGLISIVMLRRKLSDLQVALTLLEYRIRKEG